MQPEESCVIENFTKNNKSISDHKYTHDALQRAINDIIKIEGYVTYRVKSRIQSSNGDSFLGAHCEVDIQGKTVEGDKRSNVFIKICNPDQEIAFVDLSQAYLNELYVYKELSNIYASLQEEFNVPLKKRYGMLKFYNGCSQDIIPLENMREMGFTTHNRTEKLSLDFMELAMIELAKFHTLSFVLEYTRPTYFAKKIKNINTTLKFNEEWVNFVTILTQPIIKLVDNDREMKLVAFLKDLTKNYAMHIQDVNCIRCFCHGDYKPSNILMKIVDGVISILIPIDYQMIYYGCPVLDFLYFIFTSTDREFRREHLSHLKDLYHGTLKKFLEYFNMKVESVYPRNEFEKDFEEKLEYGFMISLIVTPILFGENDLLDLNVTEVIKAQVNDECKRRLLGSIEEFIERGYL